MGTVGESGEGERLGVGPGSLMAQLWALSTLACVLVSRPQQVSPSLLPDPPLSITHCRKSLESP